MKLGFKIDVVVEVPEGANEDQTIEAVKNFLHDTGREALFIGQVPEEDGEAIEVVSTHFDESVGWHHVGESHGSEDFSGA